MFVKQERKKNIMKDFAMSMEILRYQKSHEYAVIGFVRSKNIKKKLQK